MISIRLLKIITFVVLLSLTGGYSLANENNTQEAQSSVFIEQMLAMDENEYLDDNGETNSELNDIELPTSFLILSSLFIFVMLYQLFRKATSSESNFHVKE